MNIAQELSIVKDNIAEYGMTNITQLEYDAIYEQGRRDAEKELNALGECEYRKGMADAIDECISTIRNWYDIHKFCNCTAREVADIISWELKKLKEQKKCTDL